MQKTRTFFVVFMLMLSATFIASINIYQSVAAAIPSKEIDTCYVFNISQNLSKIIFEVPSEGLDKGRAFATDGEWAAADHIMKEMKNNLSLYGPTNNQENQYYQQIQNLLLANILNYPAIIHGGNLRTKLVINSRNLTFYNNQLNTNTYIEEFYISPRWNLTGQYLYNHTYRTDCLANDLQQLSHTFTEHYLNIKTDIPNYTKWVIDFFENYTTEFKNLTVDYINNDITDDMAFWTDFFVPTFEDHYDFKIDDINISDNTTFPTFYRDIVPETDAFVYIEEDQQYNPNKSDTISDKIQNTLRELFNDTYWAIFQEKLSHFPNILPNVRKTLYLLWYKLVTKTITTLFTDQWGKFRTVLLAKLQPKWRGFIRYDFHPHAYDMNYVPYRAMPIIWINGTIGTTINENASQYRVNYTLEQYYDTAAISYNVIGQINGSDPTKTMIISTLMDSWWNQGTADSAIGMGIVLALAKYMKELTEPPYNLIPRYNIKFIAFSGEEYGLRGAHYYQKIYKTQFNEDIVLVLDLNQLGFKQPDDREEPDPDLTMHVQTNKILNRLLLEKVCGNTNYVARLNDDRTHMSKIDYTSLGTFPSNAFAFLLPPELLTTTTVLFLKEKSNWTMHHRDGEDHEEGDVMDYFYWDDVNLTAEMIWNATKLYAFNPNCWFTDTTFVEWDDTDEDSFPDTINASITMRTVMPRDHLVLKGFLNHVNFQFNNIYTEQQTKDYVIERGEDITDYMNFTLDDPGAMGWYTCAIYVFNSTGEALNYGCNGFDFPIFWPVFANQSAYKTKVYVTAFNTAPGITSQPTSTVTVNPKAGVSYHYTSSTTDIEGDAIYYQWMFTNTATGETSYSPWMGPYQSGENCTVDHRWTTAGPKQVMVRARDEHLSPNIMSNWSTPLNLTLQNGVRIIAPEKVLVNKSFNVSGIAYGFTPQNFTWTFDQSEGGIKYENATNYIYDNKINQTISLSVKYNDTTWYSTEETVEVVSLLPQLTVSSMYVQSGENIIFINISKSEFSITNISWDFGDGNSSTDTMCNHSYAKPGVYTVTLMVNDSEYNTEYLAIDVYVDDSEPEFISTICYPETVSVEAVFASEPIAPICYGQNLTFNIDFMDNISGIKNTSVIIIYEDGTSGNYSLDLANHSTYDYQFIYSNTSKTGLYYYYIWVKDRSNNTNISQWYSFYVYDQFGSSSPGSYNQTIKDRITGTVYATKVTGRAESLTAFIQTNETTSPSVRCIIYRANDSVMIGATEEKSVATGENFSWVTFNFTGTKPTLTANTSYILSCWSIDTCFIRYDPINSTIGRYNNRVYNSSPPDPISWDDSKPRRYSMFCSITTFPEIKEVSATPNTVGFGGNVTLSANISDTGLIECVMVNISYPDETFENSSMINIDNDTYQYVFTDTWLTGQYNYAIWATDEQGTTNSSTSHSFNLTVNATIQVCTIKDTYTDNETINITDPPNENTIGYQFLDNNQTLLIYNPYDTNYINTTSGIQLTNHKDDFWSHNVLMLGYYDDGVWKKLYRTDELTDFTMDIESDNETYVNVTFWKDVLCKGYPARLAIRYHLGEDDTELMIIPYIKNLGNFIPYQLAFGWELKDIQIDMTTTGDYLEINGTAYYLNTSLNNSYTNLSRPIEWWNETTNQTEIIGWEPRPNFYIKENMTNNETQSLYLRWNDSLDYKVTVKSRNDQYNAPVTLFIKIGTLAAGQEKYTTLFWYDASESTYYYDAYDEGDEEWATNPSYLVDGYPWFYASTNTNNDVELLTSTTYESGGQGVVSKVELRVYGYDEGNTKIKLRPVFGGTTDGSLYEFTPGSSGAWSSWFDITNDGNAPETWSWSDIAALDVDVVSGLLFGQVNIYASKIELRVTYTVNHAPQITNPVPADDAVGVALIPLLSITVSDEEKDTMDITWLSNSSGSWQQFGSNTSVSDGTFYQVYENATEYGQWWYWRVNVTDGTNYTLSNIYKFYTGYQSKITNTGVSSFKGYLLIQVQFYNTTSSNWTVADDTVNESTPRTLMTVGSPSSGWILGLDTIFNGLVNTDNLSSFGNGTYRIYAAFRDLYGNVLMCDDETLLEAYYEFDIAFS